MKQKKVGVISLGCDKNRVDTEKMLGILREHYELTNELSEAEIVIVNTCAFLESARREAIEEILGCRPHAVGGKAGKTGRHRLPCPSGSRPNWKGRLPRRISFWGSPIMKNCPR